MKKKIQVVLLLICIMATPMLFASGEADSSSDKETTLSIWGGFPELEPYYVYCAEEFKAIHPNVTIEPLTQSLREFEQKLSATIPSNTAGDIVQISTTIMNNFIDVGLIPELSSEALDYMNVPGRYSDFLIGNNTYNGQLWGVPIFQGQTALYYNKDMFEEAGLSGPPETMTEMAEYSKKLVKFDDSGSMIRSGHSLRLSGQGSGVAEKWAFVLYAFGGTVLVPGKKEGTYDVGFDNEAGKNALKYYIDALHVDKWDSHNTKHDAEAFELEMTAMFFRESWVIGDIAKKAPGLNYGTAAVPSDASWGRITNPVNLYVTESCENKDLAWEFIMFMNEEKNLQWLLENVGWTPVRQDIDLSPVLAKIPQFGGFTMTDPDYKEFGVTNIPSFNEIQTKLAERLVAAFLDDSLANNPAGIAKVIDEAAEEGRNILKKAGIYGE